MAESSSDEAQIAVRRLEAAAKRASSLLEPDELERAGGTHRVRLAQNSNG